MKKILLLLMALLPTIINAQTTYGDSLSMRLEATVQVSPASITLTWEADADATNYVIYRKAKGAAAWGAPLTSVGASSTQYVDNAVSVNTLYDYRVSMNSGSTPQKHGYLSSGIDVLANSNRGIALIVVENSYILNPLFQDAVNQTVEDLELDGWYPKIIYVNQSDAVSSVKTAIVNKYNEDPSRTKLLLLLGHVPVPHSGNVYPDGHTDHKGAWPTDTYYADMDGVWNDISVNETSSGNPRNHNIPGDGKPDDDYIPSPLELQVGRVDLAELPSYTLTEEELMLRYMDKLHRFKSAEIVVSDKALIDDNFTSYAEGFSQNGYRNFSALVGRNNFVSDDYFTQLSYNTSTSGTYAWSYGCGAGWYSGASGIGSSSSFPADSLSSVFTMLFGSYFGDWDYSDAFLRAALGQGNTLTNCWAGRPNWHFYHMAMGETIGYSTNLTQNNSGLYYASTVGGLSQMITINLMGDPSLRMHYITPPQNLNIVAGGSTNSLTWTAGATEIGYNVYRRYADSVDFVKLNSSLITATNFTDFTLSEPGTVYYYVKAVELKTTPSGTYYNESIGIKDSAVSTVAVNQITQQINFNVFPNPSKGNFTISVNEFTPGIHLEIFNAQGQKVYNKNNLQHTQEEISLRIPAGIYTVKVTGKKGTSTKRIIIEN